MRINSVIFASILLIFLGLKPVAAQENYNKAQSAPQQKEVILCKSTRTPKGYSSFQAAYKAALSEAQQAYPDKDVAIRNLKKGEVKVNSDGSVTNYYDYTIVALPSVVEQKLMEAINKATCEIEENNCFALDKLTVIDGQTDKEKTKGLIVDILLGKGYKVVAKEYLEKLYKEQKGQESGIYNQSTTVEGNNFTAVGYYLSVRITEEYVQVHVVNVSTGEYAGNVTANI